MFTPPQQPPHSVSTCTEEVHPHQKLSVIPGVQHYPKKPLHTQIKHHLTNECLLTVHNTNHVIICFYYWIAIVSIPVCVQPPFTRKLRERLCLANFPEVKFDPTPLFSHPHHLPPPPPLYNHTAAAVAVAEAASSQPAAAGGYAHHHNTAGGYAGYEMNDYTRCAFFCL